MMESLMQERLDSLYTLCHKGYVFLRDAISQKDTALAGLFDNERSRFYEWGRSAKIYLAPQTPLRTGNLEYRGIRRSILKLLKQVALGLENQMQATAEHKPLREIVLSPEAAMNMFVSPTFRVTKSCWTRHKQTDLRALVSELAAYNEDFLRLLRRNQDMEIAQKLILDVLDAATHTFRPGNPKAASIIELREINERNICEETLGSETGSIENTIASSSSNPPPAAVEKNLEIPISSFQSFETPKIPRVVIDRTSPESNIARSPLTRYRYVYNSEKSWSEELVFVEWRLRKHGVRNTFDEEAQAQRYSYFVRLLQRTSRVDPGLCTLPCLGYSLATGQLPDGKKCPIVGYVFKFPKHANSTARLLTLDDKIASCPGILASPSPNLESRFCLSQKLTLALLQLHIAGWKHRQLSSSNIIFFRNEGDQWDDLSKPYISAWQCLSDDYRMQGDNTDIDMKSLRFWKGEDLKSLAVILMQIGLWEYPCNAYHRLSNSNLPGVSMDYRGPFSLQYVQSLYRVLGAQLRAKMGSHYAKSVKECSQGPYLASSTASLEKHLFNEVMQGLYKSVNN